MVKAYRLFRSRYAPWNSEGSALRGGRWNSVGTHMIYASSRALACLEVLVHVRNPAAMPAYHYCEIGIPKEFISRLEESEATAVPASEILSREFGDRWVREGIHYYNRPRPEHQHRGVLEVPSVVIPQEMNYLINPNHAHFPKLHWFVPEPFIFDPRLLRTAADF